MKAEAIKVNKGFKIPIPEDSPLMDMTMSSLNMPVRMVHAMHRNGYFTVAKFVRDWPLSPHKLAVGFRGIGANSWKAFWSALIDAQFELLSEKEADAYARRIIAVNYLRKGE